MRVLSTLLTTAAFAVPFAPAMAADAPVAGNTADDAAAAQSADIVVVGRGDTRQVQTLTNKDIDVLLPAISPLKAIQKLPGVNFQSADAFGAYEWSERVSIRGFNQNQIGFTLDGIPLGDGTYGNTNGLHISRAIPSENIGRVQVSQGAGSIGTQATNNLGGTIEFFSADPKDHQGVDANLTYGSDNTFRAFARLDTGALNDRGGGIYVAYAHLETDKWKGYGSQRQDMANAKAVLPFSDTLRGVATFNYSDRRENDYQDMSLEMIDRLGYNWDNISNDFVTAVKVADVGANTGYTGAPQLNPAAGTVYPAPFANPDDAYFDAAGLRQDILASVGLESHGDSAFHASLKGYYHWNHGQGIWFTPYVPSPSGVPISVRTTEYDINRKGVFGSVDGDLGAFGKVTVGAWYERNDFEQARRYYGLDSRTVSTRDSLEFQTNPFATQWFYKYGTDTVQYYVQDKLTFGQVTVNLGWKGFDVKNSATPYVAGSLTGGKISVTDWFQPHAGVNYKISNNAELFADFTQVTRAFVSAATSGPFATTPAGFAGLGNLKPEASDTYEVGGRFRSGPFTGSLTGYWVNFRNRLLAFSNGAGIVGNPAILQNVGGVQSKGVEATAQLRLPNGFGGFVSYAYNDSSYQDNVLRADGTVFAATKGKTVVDSPKHILSGEITYDSDLFFGRFGGNYMSKRYFSYLNDASVDGRVIFDATLGVRFEIANGKKVELQLNATNLFDKKYVSTVGTNGFGNSGDNQTLLTGAPQQFFVTLKTGF